MLEITKCPCGLYISVTSLSPTAQATIWVLIIYLGVDYLWVFRVKEAANRHNSWDHSNDHTPSNYTTLITQAS